MTKVKGQNHGVEGFDRSDWGAFGYRGIPSQKFHPPRSPCLGSDFSNRPLHSIDIDIAISLHNWRGAITVIPTQSKA